MELQEFVLVVAGVPGSAVLRSYDGLAPAPGPRDGIGAVVVRRHAPDLAEAVTAAVRDAESAGLRPVRVATGDWVRLADVAARIGRSREIVRLWSVGRQGPGGFPPPLNPGCDTSFYSWAEIAQWLRRRLGYELPDEEPVLVAMNLALQLRRLAPRIARMDAVRELMD
ncbi:hypothetical protein RB614_00090 [Phytohabitans sp. ZYX-F-186]|uniref:DNA-binding protein n=1 Tax=Phytohabitans maris TaxID=3071409 RepID=A0ABU0Z8Y0_9ACTN|nr:hypothetical protein [Phytohabitans sp. ZYX-F-186]MDQ7902919.1 hypothetical protein [Phytohabitans sp. ZYX-F-186]